MPEGRGGCKYFQCGILTDWEYIFFIVMPDATLLPDGKVLILNGAETGTGGYGNAPDQVNLQVDA